jgi:formylglycine-generating enzyme required for sulfatase activity
MANLRQLRWLPVASLAIPLLRLVACRSVTDQGREQTSDQPTSPGQSGDQTAAQATPTPTPIAIQIRPTHTPLPPPPTPTLPPTNTPAPESKETEEVPAIAIRDAMVEIPAGPFILGNDNSDPNEAPAQEMDLPAFMLDAFEVANTDFAAFVEATGYVTYREQEGSPQNWRSAFTDLSSQPPIPGYQLSSERGAYTN